MKKFDDGRIGFNSTLEHRVVERIRMKLKKLGIINIKTLDHDKFSYIMEGVSPKFNEKFKIFILIRTIVSDKVSMNLTRYECEKVAGDNPLLILADRRHLYPIKFSFLDDIRSVEYVVSSTPLVLFREDNFEEISILSYIL